MSEHVELDFINEIYLNTTPTLYLIDLDSLFEKKQNILFKIIRRTTYKCIYSYYSRN